LYLSIAKATGWTFYQIGELTNDAKKVLMGWTPDDGYKPGADIISFKTEEEYLKAVAAGLFKGK
jgi:hypothetical protein